VSGKPKCSVLPVRPRKTDAIIAKSDAKIDAIIVKTDVIGDIRGRDRGPKVIRPRMSARK
jgi:hypothetical protein